jgi:CRISPR-associated protein Cas2
MPYVIAVYDIRTARVAKVMRIFRQYLHHVQNSAFEGYLTDSQLESLRAKVEKIIVKEEDSVIYYTLNNPKWINKQISGIEKNKLDFII